MKNALRAIRTLIASMVAKDLYPEDAPRYTPPPASFSQDNNPNALKVKLLKPNAKLPRRVTPGSVGYDVYAIEGGLCLPSDIARIPLGIAVELPAGHVGILVGRSGFGLRYGAGVPQGLGVIDADFRQEISMLLTVKVALAWKAGDRIGQLLVLPYATPEVQEVQELSETMRTGGFGSSGRR